MQSALAPIYQHLQEAKEGDADIHERLNELYATVGGKDQYEERVKGIVERITSLQLEESELKGKTDPQVSNPRHLFRATRSLTRRAPPNARRPILVSRASEQAPRRHEEVYRRRELPLRQEGAGRITAE